MRALTAPGPAMTPVSLPLLQHPALIAALLLTVLQPVHDVRVVRAPEAPAGLSLVGRGLISWGIALFEYLLQVPAQPIGFTVLSLAQLKIMQEVITLACSCPSPCCTWTSR